MIPTFQCKEFSVSDADCGQKLSTDAILLGAYANPPASGRILDIGCGCGILALMMAQQSRQATIDSVEINKAAACQAQQNFENSPWALRLKVYHVPVQEFTYQSQGKYNFIISNPPYFHEQLKSAEAATRQSKHSEELSFTELCKCVVQLLYESGTFWVIMPVSEKIGFLNAALAHSLFCRKMLTIFDKADKPPVRLIFCLQKQMVMTAEWDELVIRGEDNEYTAAYIELTKDFYL